MTSCLLNYINIEAFTVGICDMYFFRQISMTDDLVDTENNNYVFKFIFFGMINIPQLE